MPEKKVLARIPYSYSNDARTKFFHGFVANYPAPQGNVSLQFFNEDLRIRDQVVVENEATGERSVEFEDESRAAIREVQDIIVLTAGQARNLVAKLNEYLDWYDKEVAPRHGSDEDQ